VHIYALAETIAALRQHVFNNVIWPDFSRIPSAVTPLLKFHEVQVGQVVQLGHQRIEVLSAVHTVPAVGYAVSGTSGRHWVFTGDTEKNPAFWTRLNQLDVGMLVIETAFSNSQAALAERSQHLSPQALAGELTGIDAQRHFPIYITHTKPAQVDLIMSEIFEFNQVTSAARPLAHDIRWLYADQEFEV